MAPPLINELVADHVGTDTNEFVEILGDPSTSYDSYRLIQVESDAGGTLGRVISVTAIGTTDANGLWTSGFLRGGVGVGVVPLGAAADGTPQAVHALGRW